MIKVTITPVYELGKIKQVHTIVKFLGITIYKRIATPIHIKEDDDDYLFI